MGARSWIAALSGIAALLLATIPPSQSAVRSVPQGLTIVFIDVEGGAAGG
jgi:hypothetical protein